MDHVPVELVLQLRPVLSFYMERFTPPYHFLPNPVAQRLLSCTKNHTHSLGYTEQLRGCYISQSVEETSGATSCYIRELWTGYNKHFGKWPIGAWLCNPSKRRANGPFIYSYSTSPPPTCFSPIILGCIHSVKSIRNITRAQEGFAVILSAYLFENALLIFYQQYAMCPGGWCLMRPSERSDDDYSNGQDPSLMHAYLYNHPDLYLLGLPLDLPEQSG